MAKPTVILSLAFPRNEVPSGEGPPVWVFSLLDLLRLFIAVTVNVCVSLVRNEVVVETTPRTRFMRALWFRVMYLLYLMLESIEGKILKII